MIRSLWPTRFDPPEASLLIVFLNVTLGVLVSYHLVDEVDWKILKNEIFDPFCGWSGSNTETRYMGQNSWQVQSYFNNVKCEAIDWL